MNGTKRSRIFRRATFALLAVAVCAAGCRRPAPPGGGGRSANEPLGPRRVVALGRLEPARGILEIRAIPGETVSQFGSGLRDDNSPPDNRDEYGVAEGLMVQSGGVLAWLKSFDVRQTQFEALEKKLDLGRRRRQHEIAVAEAQLEQAKIGVVQAEAKLAEVSAQQAKVDALGEAAAIALAEVAKLRELRADDAELVTEHELRRQASKAALAEAEHAAAVATLGPAITTARRGVDAARTNRKLAEANLSMARELDPNVATELELKAAEQAREQSVLRAPEPASGPIDYTVLDVSVEPGEFATQLPAFQIADLSDMACIAEVYEADAKDVHVGQTVKIRSAAFEAPFNKEDDGLDGVVLEVGRLVSSPGLMNRNPLAPSDRSVIEVHIDITDPREGATTQAARLVGMQVTVEFQPVKDADAKK